MSIVLNMTRGFVTIIDDEDYSLVSQYKWFPSKGNTTIYAVAHGPTINGKRETVRLHRLIMGAKPEQQVDHKDGNGLDNRKENLRLASASQNSQNLRRFQGVSNYKGVCYDNSLKTKKHWRARISIENKRIHLGYFISEKDAAQAYNSAAIKYFGEFALLNFKETL